MVTTIHATCVAIGGQAVLLTGASGAGKSDLALRLIDRGAILVADDYTIVEHDGASLTARPPATIAGRIEVRGIGIVARPWLDVAPVALVVELGAETDRMPEPRTIALHGVQVSAVVVDPHRPSAPIKVEWALAHIRETRA